ncbi:hypothetical protein PILCRDRAFT_203925 [Piloderma croceum F 1598]|uniref:Uncharacterized protein n=1 Tax=Piloderma croceum (strain F 1598) TaxID=765440 RepID=A0A0C3GE75_PILCF|nr:hypothetical protein PILCRDRAFT_203925 [Piloderma croceum F 1598]
MSVGVDMLSPISAIPSEVLSTIFEAVCLSSSLRPTRLPVEIVLSHVSGHWRSVSLNDPHLWTGIHVDLRASGHLPMTEAYLSRSGALLLDINLDLGYRTNTEQVDVASIYQILAAHIHRWYRLQLVCCQQELNTLLDLIPTPAAPHLRRIDISLDASTSDVNRDMINRDIFSQGASSLMYIRLRGVALQTCLPPLGAVTHLRIDEPARDSRTSPRKLSYLLSGLSALTHLVLSGDYEDDGIPPIPVELPSLRFLHTLIFTDMLPTILNMISAPQLESLLLEKIFPEDTDGFADLQDLTSGSPKFPSLKSLTLLPTSPRQEFPESTWRNVMRTFPSISHITLSFDNLTNFLVSLRPQKSGQTSQEPAVPLQNLCTMTLISQLRLFPSATAVLCNTVSARIIAGYPIRKLRLSKGILHGLRDKLDWLRARITLENTKQYQNIPRNTYFADLPDDEVWKPEEHDS